MTEPSMEVATASGPELRDAVGAIPEHCRQASTVRGLLAFARDLGMLAVAVALLVTIDHPLVLLPAWLLAGLAISALFVVGHDAAHRTLFRSHRLCHVVGQVAMLPSLHPYEAWSFGHNRVHHAFTTCRDLDFVWHPATAAEYARLSRWGRLQHRIEWSAFGCGAYYVRHIWWNQLMRGTGPARLAGMLRRERTMILAFFLLGVVTLGYLGLARYGSMAGAGWMWAKVFLVPWLIWNTLIGWTVYLHHIHPRIAWYPRGQWRKFRGQVESTTTLRLPAWAEFFAHNIFFHVAHHVDPRIPFYHLPEATKALQARFGSLVRETPYRLRDYVETTRRCKVYDFDTVSWLDYESRPAARVL